NGTYTGQVAFTVSGGTTQTLGVTFTVGTGSSGGTLTINPSAVSLTAPAGSTSLVTQQLTVTSSSAVTLNASASTNSGGNWLLVAPAGMTEPATSFSFIVYTNPTALPSGTYTGQVQFAISGGATQTLSVTLRVVEPGRLLSSKSSLTFPDNSNSNNPFAPQFLLVSTVDASQVTISVSASTTSGGTWLSASPTTPTTATFVQVSVNTSGLGNGTYQGAIQISAPGTTLELLVIPVSLTIAVPAVSVTVTTAPAGLPITVDGQSYFAPATFSWLPGGSHSLGTVASQTSNGTRNTFSSWSDGGSQIHSVTAPSAAATITANFQTSYLLTTNVIGGSGGISVQPATNDGYYQSGSTVQLTAQPSAGSQFVSWSGDASGNGNPIPLSMTAPRTVGAAFGPFAPCTITLNGSSASVSAYGDILRVRIAAGSGCSWQSFSSVPWVTILSGFSGSGSGTVRIKVDANSDGTSRAGTVSIAGIPYTLTQAAGGCAFQVSGPATALPGSSAGYQLTIKASSPNCQWNAAASAPWVTLTGATTGSGNGTVSFSLANNSAADPRNGYIIAGGQWGQFVQKSLVPSLPFSDVPVTHLFFDSISLLKTNNISVGCGSWRFCPEAPVTRSEMAAFIIRALFGESFTFPPTPYFDDAGPSHPYFAYIQKLREIGVTNGCAATAYCPDATVTRGQMAAFLVRARLGVTANESFPFSPAPLFEDVSTSNLFYAYIQKMKQLGITDGCTATKYCPDDTNTRGQMSVFVVRGLLDP
ncbi:MAG: BACON domain-containing protein, partial [Bryobacterales bacterium]|nr:BACON domain-containing protein [Bryobacterales bacterium]